MSDAFYGSMQTLATGLLTQFNQGLLELTRTEQAPNASEPWKPGVETTRRYRLVGAVAPVQKRFVNGQSVLESDSQATVGVAATLTHVDGAVVTPQAVLLSDVEPTPSDTFTVDGRPRTVVGVRRIPDAGVAVAYAFILRS